MVVLRHALTQLVVTHAPASLVIDWEMMNERVLVSNVPHCIQITIMIIGNIQISMNALRVPTAVNKHVQIPSAVTPALVAQGIS